MRENINYFKPNGKIIERTMGGRYDPYYTQLYKKNIKACEIESPTLSGQPDQEAFDKFVGYLSNIEHLRLTLNSPNLDDPILGIIPFDTLNFHSVRFFGELLTRLHMLNKLKSLEIICDESKYKGKLADKILVFLKVLECANKRLDSLIISFDQMSEEIKDTIIAINQTSNKIENFGFIIGEGNFFVAHEPLVNCKTLTISSTSKAYNIENALKYKSFEDFLRKSKIEKVCFEGKTAIIGNYFKIKYLLEKNYPSGRISPKIYVEYLEKYKGSIIDQDFFNVKKLLNEYLDRFLARAEYQLEQYYKEKGMNQGVYQRYVEDCKAIFDHPSCHLRERLNYYHGIFFLSPEALVVNFSTPMKEKLTSSDAFLLASYYLKDSKNWDNGPRLFYFIQLLNAHIDEIAFGHQINTNDPEINTIMPMILSEEQKSQKTNTLLMLQKYKAYIALKSLVNLDLSSPIERQKNKELFLAFFYAIKDIHNNGIPTKAFPTNLDTLLNNPNFEPLILYGMFLYPEAYLIVDDFLEIKVLEGKSISENDFLDAVNNCQWLINNYVKSKVEITITSCPSTPGTPATPRTPATPVNRIPIKDEPRGSPLIPLSPDTKYTAPQNFWSDSRENKRKLDEIVQIKQEHTQDSNKYQCIEPKSP